jgi:hypothetical protein
MLISPGATPSGDLYLFLALVVLVEISIFIGKRIEHRSGKVEDQSMLSKWLEPAVPTCRYCSSEIKNNVRYCPSCKRAIG